jgi:hypothetical protein
MIDPNHSARFHFLWRRQLSWWSFLFPFDNYPQRDDYRGPNKKHIAVQDRQAQPHFLAVENSQQRVIEKQKKDDEDDQQLLATSVSHFINN